MKKNTEVCLLISDLGVNGEGIAKKDQNVYFVPFALPGEKVTAEVAARKKNLCYARLRDVLTPADERVRPKCPVYKRCGGCQLQHLKYTNQLKHKAKVVEDCFRKIARLRVEVAPTVRSDHEYHYRNKLQMPIGSRHGRTILGFYRPGSHAIVPTDDCSLHPDWTPKLLSAVAKFLDEYNIPPYDEQAHRGLARHLLAREAEGRLLITLVINADGAHKFPRAHELYSRLAALFPECGFYLNLHDKPGNLVASEEFLHIGGSRLLRASSLGINYNVGPGSFTQVNPYVRDRLYQKVCTLSAPTEGDVIIDAYSGAGLLTACLARHCQTVYGIEMVKEAVESANLLAEENNLVGRMKNIHGTCETVLPPLISDLRKAGTKRITVILDPPRKGCAREVMDALLQTLPETIIYISCNPATLARDAGILMGTLNPDGSPVLPPQPEQSAAPIEQTAAANGEQLVAKPVAQNEQTADQAIPTETVTQSTEQADSTETVTQTAENPAHRYEITFIRPYDMFPMTRHVECVVLMSRVKY